MWGGTGVRCGNNNTRFPAAAQQRADFLWRSIKEGTRKKYSRMNFGFHLIGKMEGYDPAPLFKSV